MAYRKKTAETADKTTEKAPVKPTTKARATSEKLVDVELNSSFACDTVGTHRVYKSYGNFVFTDGKAKVSASAAELLRKDLVIK